MAGYVIHLAVAEAYKSKHPDDIENYDDFIQGIIFPDSVYDKSITHYGEKSSKVNLREFLKENEINNDYDKGYFLHLVTDYIFYNKFLECFSKDIYNDYDVTNKELIDKYNVTILDTIKDKVFFKDGDTKVMSIDLAKKVIDEVSELNLEEIINEINNDDPKWKTFKTLEKR